LKVGKTTLNSIQKLSTTLESLKSLRTLILEFGRGQMEVKSVEIFLKSLATQTQLTKFYLTLSVYDFTKEFGKLMAEALAKMPQLKQFNFSCFHCKEKFHNTFIETLGNLRNLKELTIGILSQKGKDIKCLSLASPISKMNLTSLNLGLSYQFFSDVDLLNLFVSISGQRELVSLTLGLSSSKLSDFGVRILCLSISKLKYLEKLNLSFNSNFITDVGAESVIEFIDPKKFRFLKLLIIIIKYNKLSQEMMDFLNNFYGTYIVC
jgi:hypothetical protein